MRKRDKFEQDELNDCLGHYDLGGIKSIREFKRGSSRSPKVVIESERGKFLFKRRAKGKDDRDRVEFTHEIQLFLAERDFPLPHLVRTKDDQSMLVLDSKIYEMFEYATGEPYDGSAASTLEAGRSLGLYHKLLEQLQPRHVPLISSYHDAKMVHEFIRKTVSSLPLQARPPAEVLTATVSSIEDSYKSCAEHVKKQGLDDWPLQIVHGDWHPGNMLFEDKKVVAVIDYDSARKQQRVIDLANGALQFSIIGGAGDPGDWPEQLDEDRLASFIKGYYSINPVSDTERRTLPCLMCEALIAEAVLPIAATGSFGKLEGFTFLQMIDRKVGWMLSHLDQLRAAIAE